jgi:hypothetical protein
VLKLQDGRVSAVNDGTLGLTARGEVVVVSLPQAASTTDPATVMSATGIRRMTASRLENKGV